MISLLVQLFSNEESTNTILVPCLLASSRPVSWNRSSRSFTIDQLRKAIEAYKREVDDMWFNTPMNRPVFSRKKPLNVAAILCQASMTPALLVCIGPEVLPLRKRRVRAGFMASWAARRTNA
jgi:hypothetical protein